MNLVFRMGPTCPFVQVRCGDDAAPANGRRARRSTSGAASKRVAAARREQTARRRRYSAMTRGSSGTRARQRGCGTARSLRARARMLAHAVANAGRGQIDATRPDARGHARVDPRGSRSTYIDQRAVGGCDARLRRDAIASRRRARRSQRPWSPAMASSAATWAGCNESRAVTGSWSSDPRARRVRCRRWPPRAGRRRFRAWPARYRPDCTARCARGRAGPLLAHRSCIRPARADAPEPTQCPSSPKSPGSTSV